jgi:hypothetical protein
MTQRQPTTQRHATFSNERAVLGQWAGVLSVIAVLALAVNIGSAALLYASHAVGCCVLSPLRVFRVAWLCAVPSGL